MQWLWAGYDFVLALFVIARFWPSLSWWASLFTWLAYLEVALYEALVLNKWFSSWVGNWWIRPGLPWWIALAHGLAFIWVICQDPVRDEICPVSTKPEALGASG